MRTRKRWGEDIRKSGVDRRELFITTKVNTTEMCNGTVRESLEKSLANLGTDYIDLVLVHWPVKGHIKETWQILEEYVDKEKIHSIGVSNINPHHIDELLEYVRIRPVVNQIEIEPYFDFELSPSEMEIISGLNRNQRVYEQNDPDNFPW